MTQQHITQEMAVALARKVAASNGDTLKDVPEKETIELLHGLANAAIQHYLDQHKAELPVLPDTYGSVDEQIVERYRVGKTQGGFWPSCVKAGDGNMDVFVGSTKQAENVRQALQTACLDGAFIASQKAKEQYKDYGQQCAAHARKLALEEAKEAIESANARRVLYVPDCIDVIEELHLLAQTLEFSDAVRCSIQRAADLLQSQAERIRELEEAAEESSADAVIIQYHEAAIKRLKIENDTLRAQLAEIAASEPVAWRGRCTDPLHDWCLFYRRQESQEKFLNMEWQPLFTRPMPARPQDHEIRELVDRLTAIAKEYGQMQQLRERIAQEIRPFTFTKPAQDVTELVEALEGLMHKDCGEPAFVKARTALSKGAK